MRDPEAIYLFRRKTVDALAIQVDFAFGCMLQARNRAHRGRLSGTIIADERDNLAFRDRKVQAANGRHLAIMNR
ncbi:MAG: hypothetical protein U5K73_09595 [Halofilum sp. (in: g-proteobacteria)]|nr:hypothetical protein [Halofilum sp. (in: g-proteobacteria)]